MKRVIGTVLVVCLFVNLNAVASDVSGWAYNDVMDVFDSNMIDEAYFDDYKNHITRSDYGYIMFQLYEYLSGEPIAYDIDLSQAYQFSDTSDLYLIALKGAGVISGYPDGSYLPEATISREEIMTLYIRLLEKLGYTFEQSQMVFSDEGSISRWAYDAVKKCYAAGLIKGKGNGLIDPKGNATIEESLVMLSRIMKDVRYQPANVTEIKRGHALVSDGNNTYAVSYDLLGEPVGIESYRDFDYEDLVVTDYVKETLCMDKGILYYVTKDGLLTSYDGIMKRTLDQIIDVDDWYVLEGRLYTSMGNGYDIVDIASGLDVTNDLNSNTQEPSDLTLQNHKIIHWSGDVIYNDVLDFAEVDQQLIILGQTKELLCYNLSTRESSSYGFVDADRLYMTSNYLVLEENLRNDTTMIRYLPIFDIKRFIGTHIY